MLKKIHTNTSLPSDKTYNFLSNTVAPIAFTMPVAMFVTGLSTHNKDLQIKSIESGASILFASAISYSIKISVKRPRPFTTYPDLITKKGHGGTFSFPSGHTTTSFAIATSLSLAFPKWYVIIPSYTFASAVAYSRMHLGMHYPSDLLAGIIIGMGTSFLTFQADKWLNKKYPN
jgi:undecaprenyl-diphosphatase